MSSDRGKNEKIEGNHPNKQAKIESDAMQMDTAVEQSEQSIKREAQRKQEESKQRTIGGF